MTTETKVVTIKWGDVDHHHHGKAAIVRTPSSFPKPNGWSGIIQCKTNGTKPILDLGGTKVMTFAWWHDVELR